MSVSSKEGSRESIVRGRRTTLAPEYIPLALPVPRVFDSSKRARLAKRRFSLVVLLPILVIGIGYSWLKDDNVAVEKRAVGVDVDVLAVAARNRVANC